MPRVAWTPAAEDDLEQIILYIGRTKRSPAAASRVLRTIVDQCNSIAEQPLIAEARPELGPAVRAFRVYQYLIIFRPRVDGVEILRVIHGARDVPSVFGQ